MKKALSIILMSLSVAVIFNYLFFGKMVGVSVGIFATVLLASVFFLGQTQKLPLKKIWWLALLIIFFSFMVGVNDHEFLTLLNVWTSLGLLVLLAHELVGTPTFLMKFWDYFTFIVLTPFQMLGRAFSTIALVGQIHSQVKRHDVWLRIFKGVIMALPILIIFGVLFSQADLAFSKFLQGFINITISQTTIEYFVLLFIAFVAALSFLSYIFSSKPVQTIPQAKSEIPVPLGRGIEVMVFLSLIATLFIVFIGFQVTYLFGGESNIVNAGFTYAEYARRGFWELLAVGVISLLLLLASEKYADVEGKKDRRFLIPNLILIAEVVVVIISAFKRLSLYIDAYSMTRLRFYVAAFIILLLVWFILLAIKFIKTRKEQFFTFGVLLSVLAFLVTVNIISPDAFIAKSNMKEYRRTGKIDVSYIGSLSADAMPWKIELYKKLEGTDKTVMQGLLQKQKDELQEFSTDWQATNVSRSRAWKLLQELGE
jgi:hypothetical protein